MPLRERIADILTLQTHILQGYFSMAVTANFSGDSWKPLFLDEVQKGVTSNFSHNYRGASEELDFIGLENYTVCHMDTTIITTILQHPINGFFRCCTSNWINQRLDQIRGDRNILAHTAGNESDSELVQLAYGSLHNLRIFITAVATSRGCNISDDIRTDYVQTYQAKIKDLRLKIGNDSTEALRKKEIDHSTGVVTGGVKNTLHEAIRIVLSERNDKTLHASKLADIIYERKLYLRQDGGQAPSSQIRARCRDHPKLFEFIGGGNIRLK